MICLDTMPIKRSIYGTDNINIRLSAHGGRRNRCIALMLALTYCVMTTYGNGIKTHGASIMSGRRIAFIEMGFE